MPGFGHNSGAGICWMQDRVLSHNRIVSLWLEKSVRNSLDPSHPAAIGFAPMSPAAARVSALDPTDIDATLRPAPGCQPSVV